MAEQRRDDGTQTAGAGERKEMFRRRGLMAGAAALVAGVLARKTEQSVAAGSDGDVILGAVNPATGTTGAATVLNGNVTTTATLRVTNGNYTGTLDNVADGIQGFAHGTSNGVPNVGVFGRNDDAGGIGVQGVSAGGAGIWGISTNAYGVMAQCTNGSGVNASSTNGFGLYATSGGNPNPNGGIAVVGNPTGAAYAGQFNGYVSVDNHGAASGGGTALSGTSHTAQAPGVFGNGAVSGAYGVYGQAASGGLAGYFSGAPVIADNPSGTAVQATTHYKSNDLNNLTPAISGIAAVANSVAVAGTASDPNAHAGQFTGFVGVNASGYGLYATTTAGPYVAVTGTGAVETSYGVWGQAKVSGAQAGLFTGPVSIANGGSGVNGTLTVNNTTTINGDFMVTGSKNAAVKHPDGSYRLLHCVEAPEPWFEDVGDGKLTGGAATVKLDPDFAPLVDAAGKYYVFLTPEGECKGLAVTNKTAAGFEVHELQGGTSNITFSYRVVAKRKDIKGERLAKATLPALPPTPPEPKLPGAPTVLPTPAPPDLPPALKIGAAPAADGRVPRTEG